MRFLLDNKAARLRWLGTLLALVLLIYVLSRQGWAEFWRAFQTIPVSTFLIAIGLMILSRLMVCGRWHVLLRSAGMRISIRQSVTLVFAGLFASNFLPTTVGGDVMRLAGAVQLKLDSAITAASLVMDRIIGSIGMATLLPVSLPSVLGLGAGLIPWPGKGSAVIETWRLQPHALSLSFLAGLKTRKWAFGSRFWGWLKKFLHTLLNTFVVWSRHPWALLGALLWSYGHMLCLFTTTWLLFRGMGESISWWMVGGLWVLTYFITLLPVSVNGLGVQEVAITYFYSNFGGVSVQSAVALAVLIRMLYVAASLPGVAFLPSLIRPTSADPSIVAKK